MLSHIIQHDYIQPFENCYASKQNLKLAVLLKDATKVQIISRKFQQITNLTGQEISSQSGGKRSKLPRPAPFKK
jgi:hypothetical protein